MPFGRYGVLVGTVHRHYRDQPDTQGRWFHVHIEVDTPGGRYECAVDVDSKHSDIGVQWKTLTLDLSALAAGMDLTPGYHDLARLPGSGALDYYRHPALADDPGCLFVRQPPPWLRQLIDLFRRRRLWMSGSYLEATEAFEPMLVPGRRILVFGEPFDEGLGVHNVHQNQGDPAGSQWWAENGIWQDGGTISERSDGRFDVFISRFSTQAGRTGDNGHPL